ncbi:MAG: 5'/3'-nucleotidase SurE [Chloroflexota bacterium]|nr:5'/3'-nucleotidase SurE [Chloroflexota bacterium]
MRILLTNDDGVDSEGLLALKKALEGKHETTVLAPDRNWSISGHMRTMDKPLRVTEVVLRDGSPAYASDGSPADCVALAALGLFDKPPELVISGINHGNNLGDDITYSGTVAAAMEGVISGIPSIAVSMDVTPNWPTEVGAMFTARLVEQIVERGLAKDILLNVNVPNLPHDEVKGVKITRLGKRVYDDELLVRQDPRGRKYYWIGGTNVTNHIEEGTDVEAIEQGYVTVTPIHMDLTNHRLLDMLRSWDLRF